MNLPFSPSSVRSALALFALAAQAAGTETAGQAALNARLLDFNTQAQRPAAAAKTTRTASADELLAALCATLIDPANTVSAADLAAGALLATSGKVRADRNALAGRIVNAAILALPDPGDSAQAGAIVRAVVTSNAATSTEENPTALDGTGRKAAILAALQTATGSDAGRIIAQQTLPLLPDTTNAGLRTFASGVLRQIGPNTAQVQSFVNGFFAPTALVPVADRATFSTALAKSVAPFHPAAAGLVIGSSVEGLDDATIRTRAVAAVARPQLKRAVTQIAASTAARLSGAVTDVNFATALVAEADLATRGRVAAGVVQATSDTSAANIAAIVAAARGSGIVAAADVAKFARHAAGGNGGSTARIKNIASALGSGAPASTRSLIGQAMTPVVAQTAPAAVEEIFLALIAPTDTVAAQKALAFDLAATVPASDAAVGGLAHAVAGSAADKVQIAVEFCKRFERATTGIARGVASTVADKPAFIADLLARPALVPFAASLAAGVAAADPANAGEIARRAALSSETTRAQAAAIARAVSRAVAVEEAADIGAKLTASELPAAQAPEIALALARSIQTSPHIPTANRADELGELAAAMTAGLLANTTDANRANLLTALGEAIFAALKSTSAPDDLNFKADQRAAADIAGSIAQTISVSTLADAQKQALLNPAGQLVTTLTSAVGPKYFVAVQAAIIEVRALLGTASPLVPGTEAIGAGGTATTTGKYEIGSVRDPLAAQKNF